jgi:hypothetical protein
LENKASEFISKMGGSVISGFVPHHLMSG